MALNSRPLHDDNFCISERRKNEKKKLPIPGQKVRLKPRMPRFKFGLCLGIALDVGIAVIPQEGKRKKHNDEYARDSETESNY